MQTHFANCMIVDVPLTCYVTFVKRFAIPRTIKRAHVRAFVGLGQHSARTYNVDLYCSIIQIKVIKIIRTHQSSQAPSEASKRYTKLTTRAMPYNDYVPSTIQRTWYIQQH